jgi:SAM-dependent methyltransferase
MTDLDDLLISQYGSEGLVDRVFEALKESRGRLEGLTTRDLIAMDSIHIRGRAATEELAGMAGVSSSWHVLDVGSGVGGTARYLAEEYSCTVTGLDITPDYVSLAEKLSELVGLEERTKFQCGSAVSTPFGDGTFDCVWMEHVLMNIPEKDRLTAELARILLPGGKLALHEVFEADGGEPLLPVPWSESPDTSFMMKAETMRQIFDSEGFTILEWQDVTGISRDWYRSMLDRFSRTGFPAVGIHLVLGHNTREKLSNVLKNLEEERVTVIQAVLEKRV